MQNFKFFLHLTHPKIRLSRKFKILVTYIFCRFIIHIFPIFDDDRMKNLGQICKSANFFNSVPLKFEWVKTSKFWSPTFHQWVMGNICEKFCESRLKNKKNCKNFSKSKILKGGHFFIFYPTTPKNKSVLKMS